MQLQRINPVTTTAAIGLIIGLNAVAAAAAVVSGPPTTHNQQRGGGDDPHFIYDRAYRLRVVVNDKYDPSSYDAVDDVLPPLTPDSDDYTKNRHYWFGYQRSTRTHGRRNIAIAFAPSFHDYDDDDDEYNKTPLAEVPIFHEQIWRQNEHSSTWAAYTDHEVWRRLTWDAQDGDEFDRDYPREHHVFIAAEGDLATGSPAPRDPPDVMLAPGTFLACAGREYEGTEVTAIRWAFDYLNETLPGAFPRRCVPVKLESRCARLEVPRFNRTWNHEEILEIPCVKGVGEWY